MAIMLEGLTIIQAGPKVWYCYSAYPDKHRRCYSIVQEKRKKRWWVMLTDKNHLCIGILNTMEEAMNYAAEHYQANTEQP
ncbi:MAG: hypothetical protein OXC91_03310 [Rhodobacteraceae bacterium]|nr:hypothetical protein [Paracoccaceae bacterium]